mmetsp:Transcript_82790/g.253066  ORF Transcript_82790/g.253066 Transcript_82790/m.253066 type:complete len:230 (+) Transcript_82790:1710-2399(+)
MMLVCGCANAAQPIDVHRATEVAPYMMCGKASDFSSWAMAAWAACAAAMACALRRLIMLDWACKFEPLPLPRRPLRNADHREPPPAPSAARSPASATPREESAWRVSTLGVRRLKTNDQPCRPFVLRPGRFLRRRRAWLRLALRFTCSAHSSALASLSEHVRPASGAASAASSTAASREGASKAGNAGASPRAGKAAGAASSPDGLAISFKHKWRRTQVTQSAMKVIAK